MISYFYMQKKNLLIECFILTCKEKFTRINLGDVLFLHIKTNLLIEHIILTRKEKFIHILDCIYNRQKFYSLCEKLPGWPRLEACTPSKHRGRVAYFYIYVTFKRSSLQGSFFIHFNSQNLFKYISYTCQYK